MTNLLRKIFPGLFPSIHVIWGFSYDIYKFLRTATDFSPENNKQKLVALLTRQYHALNTSYTVKGEKALRNAISLPLDEEPIMMLAVGHLKDSFWVTKSNRKALNEVLISE